MAFWNKNKQLNVHILTPDEIAASYKRELSLDLNHEIHLTHAIEEAKFAINGAFTQYNQAFAKFTDAANKLQHESAKLLILEDQLALVKRNKER